MSLLPHGWNTSSELLPQQPQSKRQPKQKDNFEKTQRKTKKAASVRVEQKCDMSEGKALQKKAQSTSWRSQFEFQSN